MRFVWHVGRDEGEPFEDGTGDYENYHAAKRRSCSCGEGEWVMFESKVCDWDVIEHRAFGLDSELYGVPIKFYK